jgi:flavin-dependent dehydrogenase
MNIDTTAWDVAIIGAGVAGGIAAAVLSRRAHRVILIEKSSWPREKVCGGCLTAAASSILREIGIHAPLESAQPIDRAVWHARGYQTRIETPGELAIPRCELDALIVAEAQRRGANFLPNTAASLLPAAPGDLFRTIRLQNSTEAATLRAGVVLAADGITGTFLADEPWANWRIDRNAWIGVAATCPALPFPLPANEIHMHVGNSGYVGLVRMGEDQMHLAAALDPAACKSAGGPPTLVRQILYSSRQEPISNWEFPRFRGTGTLTRRRDQLGGHRVLAVGDACGYVEPFTGEGIAWAAAGAREAAAMLPEPGEPWPDDLPRRWRKRHHELIAGRQRWCRGMRPMMRHPAMAPLVIAAANALPSVTRWIASRIAQPPPYEPRNAEGKPPHVGKASAKEYQHDSPGALPLA